MRTLVFEPCSSRSLLSLSWRRSTRNTDTDNRIYVHAVLEPKPKSGHNRILDIKLYLLKDFIFFERFSEIVYSAVKV